MLKDKNILFISARFFDYEKAIIKGLQDLGARVTYFDERPGNDVWSKGLVRVAPFLLRRKIKHHYRKILKMAAEQKFDYLFLIKGEAVPPNFFKEFETLQPNCQRILYLYDSMAEYPKFLELLPHFHRVFTFEARDALQHEILFQPLFYSDIYTEKAESTNPLYDLSFIGTAHTDRFWVLHKIEKELQSNKLKGFYYFYFPGKLTFLLKRIFDRNLHYFPLKKLQTQSLSHQEMAAFYHQSKAVLDVNKPFQFGISMRTFEVLASKTKLVTTNPEIRYYPFFHPQNILYIDREHPHFTAEFFESPFVEIDPELMKKLSLTGWLESLFSDTRDSYWLDFFVEKQKSYSV